MKSNLVDVEGELVPPMETEKAYHFYDGKVTVWLPKRLCEWDADEKTMAMPDWLAKDKGLI